MREASKAYCGNKVVKHVPAVLLLLSDCQPETLQAIVLCARQLWRAAKCGAKLTKLAGTKSILQPCPSFGCLGRAIVKSRINTEDLTDICGTTLPCTCMVNIDVINVLAQNFCAMVLHYRTGNSSPVMHNDIAHRLASSSFE